MIIGYARVSTKDQNLDRQLDQLQQQGCEKIFAEKKTGSNADRSELQNMLEYLRPGDTVIITELARISRSVKDLFEIMDKIESRSANIKSLKESWLDTTTSVGKFIFVIFAGVSQLERDLISERTKEGLSSARARGRLGGRPKCSEDQIRIALKMYNEGSFSMDEITQASQISRSTLYKYLKEVKIKEITD